MNTAIMAGRELDAEVAEKVMGWQRHLTDSNREQYVVVPPNWTDWSTARWLGHDLNELVPAYSTSIEAAWQVVARMISLGWSADLFQNSIGPMAKFEREGYPTAYSGRYGWDDPSTMAEAICRAALAAVGRNT
jgi:hypothetical protein